MVTTVVGEAVVVKVIAVVGVPDVGAAVVVAEVGLMVDVMAIGTDVVGTAVVGAELSKYVGVTVGTAEGSLIGELLGTDDNMTVGK